MEEVLQTAGMKISSSLKYFFHYAPFWLERSGFRVSLSLTLSHYSVTFSKEAQSLHMVLVKKEKVYDVCCCMMEGIMMSYYTI